jgi:succinoglycan biosynthesis protein ExoL
MKICYFVHDISHPDVPRRAAMLSQGGAAVTMLGFRRGLTPDPGAARSVVDLGPTMDGRLIYRLLAVAKALPRLTNSAADIASSQVIVARNLEMLFLSAIARRRYAKRASLIYECLDIHRLMSSNGITAKALRRLEQLLLRQSQGLIVSSPGFLRGYFQKHYDALPPTFVVENKVFLTGEALAPPSTAPAGPPWRIGWFGAIRCRRSLEILKNAIRSAPGLIEVVIAGRPARTVFGSTDASFHGVPGLQFLGPYEDETALAHLLASVHFAWTADFYDTGRNSDWLLPNRMYPAALYGAVPLAMAHVETGRWLRVHEAGILLNEPVEQTLVQVLRTMTMERFAVARGALKRIPTSALVTEPEECRELVRALTQPETAQAAAQ